MNIRSLSIKKKIFYAFLMYSVISFAISVISFVLFREIEKIDNTAHLVSDLRNKFQFYIRLDNEFLMYDIINPEYYRKGHSIYLDKQDILKNEILILTDSILASERAFEFQFEKDIVNLRSVFLQKEKIRKEISDSIYKIGFKDYGYTGDMRKAAHYLENSPFVNLVSLLMLRRHEKDYFQRNDPFYLIKHQNERRVFESSIINNGKINSRTKQDALNQMNIYFMFFDKIVELEKATGFKNNTGLASQMKIKTDAIYSLMNTISSRAESKKINIVKVIQTVIVVMVTLTIVLLLILAVSFNFIIKIDNR